MKVAVLGGYGVFGARLADLLVRDGHAVWIVGRDETKARRLADRLGTEVLVTDVRTDPERIFQIAPDVVVDAVGPFQTYGDDHYRIPRLCLEHGAHYLDLSDDAAFTAGIAALDGEAVAKDLCLLSGASSVPGISSIMAAELCDGFDDILLIDMAILPGNRAPRGTSVIASIAGQMGTDLPVWRGGMWRDQRCWGDARRIAVSEDVRRKAYLIGVPDLRLFPARFGARSVVFRAGLELSVLNRGLQALGWLRRRIPFAVSARRAALLGRLSNLFLPFGTDRGGMRVAVVGRTGGRVIRREWRLLAEAGDGPFVPTVTVRALLRDLESLPPGARPCLAEVPRAAIEAAMSDLAVSTEIVEIPEVPLFQAALADRWNQLAPEAKALHRVFDIESFSGTAQVQRGTSLVARLAGWLFGFPPAADDVPVTVTMTRTDTGEIWERRFGNRTFRSLCMASPKRYHYRERFGPFTYEQALPVENGVMHLPVRRGWFLGIPLPRCLLPASDASETVQDGVFHFDVALGAPMGAGLIVRYRGWLKPDVPG